MAKPNRNDISIGKDQWISWQDIDGMQNHAADVDDLFAPIDNFWARLETECVAECCGIDAFALWPEDIQRATVEVQDSTLLEKLDTLRDQVTRGAEKTFVSKRLNNFFHRDVLLKLIDHIETNVAIAQRTNVK
jgi:hypothetical protein